MGSPSGIYDGWGSGGISPEEVPYRHHDLRLLLPLHAGAVLRAEQPLGHRRHASSHSRRRGSGTDTWSRARRGPPRLQTNGRPGQQPERRKVQSHRCLRKRHPWFIKNKPLGRFIFMQQKDFWQAGSVSKPHNHLSHEILLASSVHSV